MVGGAVLGGGLLIDFFASNAGVATVIGTVLPILFVGGGLWKIRGWTRNKIAWSETLLVTAMWIAFAAAATFSLGHGKWLSPRTGYFATGAQVDATLLVALAVGGVPTAWKTTSKHARAWIVSGLTVAVIGTAAGLAGSATIEGTTSQQILFVLSISPIAPTVVALGIGAFERLAHQDGASPPLPPLSTPS